MDSGKPWAENSTRKRHLGRQLGAGLLPGGAQQGGGGGGESLRPNASSTPWWWARPAPPACAARSQSASEEPVVVVLNCGYSGSSRISSGAKAFTAAAAASAKGCQ